ncbi:MAG: SPOR domain-containing protein [Sterolibacterium sp.]|nr:SPOR domain-containing protein [Sterolibacterium sp.]
MTKQPPYGLLSIAKAQRGGTLLGLFLGLVVGVLIAFGVVWYLNKTPLPFLDKESRPEKTDAKPGTAPPQALPGKPGDKVNEKPRFEFYKILPSGQEAAPSSAADTLGGTNAKQQLPNVPATVDASVPPSELYYLQAGAFQKSTDADNLKAKLALMGMEASVQEVHVPDKGLMHRVRVGPFAKPEEMNRMRNQLSQNGIQTSVVKTKENVSAPQ